MGMKPRVRTEPETPPEEPSYREIREGIRDRIFGFANQMVEEYRDYCGRDWRPVVSHLIEQAGMGIHSDIEREKRIARDKAIAERREREEAEKGEADQNLGVRPTQDSTTSPEQSRTVSTTK